MGRDESTDRVARSFLAFLSLFSVKCLTVALFFEKGKQDAPRAIFFCRNHNAPRPSKMVSSERSHKQEKIKNLKKSAPHRAEREKKNTFTPYNLLTTHHARARAKQQQRKHARTQTHTYTINNILINEPKWGDINIRGAVHETFDVDGEVS
jgi:hypothetical protein